MLNIFSPDEYQSRRKKLVKEYARLAGQTGHAMLILGSEESPINYAANCYPFRQDSTFLYFVGISRPGLAAILDLDSGEVKLFADDYTADDAIWIGEQVPLAEIALTVGISEVQPRAQLASHIDTRRTFFVPPAQRQSLIELGHIFECAPEAVAARASSTLIRATVAVREIKSATELAEITRAVDASISMHEAVLTGAKIGMREYEVAAIAHQSALVQTGDALALSFPTIATSNGAVLHNLKQDGVLAAGQVFLLDAGAQRPSGYAGDLTTSFPVSATFTAQQKEIYQIVYEASEAANKLLTPGTQFFAAHKTAALTIIRGLTALGIFTGDAEEIFTSGAYALCFPHGLGHMLGLDVHDMENYGEDFVGYSYTQQRSSLFGLKSLRLAKEIRPGMVHTIEPGIYFIPHLIAHWQAQKKFSHFICYDKLHMYKNFGGIRIETDWLMTEEGPQKIGRPFDKSIQAIEKMRGA